MKRSIITCGLKGLHFCCHVLIARISHIGTRVELYAWEGGMSRSWLKEFGNGATATNAAVEEGAAQFGDRFRIIGLVKFAQDLVELQVPW